MSSPDPIALAKDVLRDEHRIKDGVDYAIVYKYGNVRVICCEVFRQTIFEVLRDVGLSVSTWATYTVFERPSVLRDEFNRNYGISSCACCDEAPCAAHGLLAAASPDARQSCGTCGKWEDRCVCPKEKTDDV